MAIGFQFPANAFGVRKSILQCSAYLELNVPVVDLYTQQMEDSWHDF